MKKPSPLRREQLQRSYKSPTRIDGQRSTSEDGVLVTKASFTTSVAAGEKTRESRPDNGPSRTGFASSVTNTSVLPTTNPRLINHGVMPKPDGHSYAVASRRSELSPLGEEMFEARQVAANKERKRAAAAHRARRSSK